MNRAWAASLSNFWHSANWPMWLGIVIAVVLVFVVVSRMLRGESAMSFGVVTMGGLLLVGIAVAAIMMRKPSAMSSSVQAVTSSPSLSAPDFRAVVQVPPTPAPSVAALPALSCLDGLAGESVESACEKALFASADSTAAAVSYTAAQITRLASYGTAESADKVSNPNLKVLRRTIEQDRYGLVAQVLMTRDGCTSTACPFFDSLTINNLIASHMNERLYDGFVGRYAALWNAPPSSPNAGPPAAALAPASGRPMSGDFPSASSTPAVNIMTPEPAAQGAQSSPRPSDAAGAQARAPAAAKKTSTQKTGAQKSRAQAPTSLAPSQADDDN